MDRPTQHNQSNNQPTEEKKFEERVLLIRRVTTKTTGGNHVSFSALVVMGDGKGSVGVGLGKSAEVPPAIKKAISNARRSMIQVPIFKSSIPHIVNLKYKAAKVVLKPAPLGTGLKVGSVARAILELAGVENASGKILGSRNQIANTYAVMKALTMLKSKVKKQESESKNNENKKNSKKVNNS